VVPCQGTLSHVSVSPEIAIHTGNSDNSKSVASRVRLLVAAHWLPEWLPQAATYPRRSRLPLRSGCRRAHAGRRVALSLGMAAARAREARLPQAPAQPRWARLLETTWVSRHLPACTPAASRPETAITVDRASPGCEQPAQACRGPTQPRYQVVHRYVHTRRGGVWTSTGSAVVRSDRGGASAGPADTDRSGRRGHRLGAGSRR
jgi:hypothetical protein